MDGACLVWFGLCLLNIVTLSASHFDGPFAGLPTPDLSNRRCGDGHNGVHDMGSPMCSGTTSDGRLAVSLAEVERRCSADAQCVAFAQFQSTYFRPVVNYTSLDNSHTGQWKTWQKHGYKPPPGPPAPPPPSPPAPSPLPPPNPPPPSIPCSPGGCFHGGTCNNTSNRCSCRAGFTGQHCEISPVEPLPKPPPPPPIAPRPPKTPANGVVAIYVDAATGKDTGLGTASAPLKTLHAAQLAVRKARRHAPGGVEVILEPGEYELLEPIQMSGPADSGHSANAPIHWWANGPPGSVLVSAGSRVEGWTHVQSNSSAYKVWSADISSLNMNGTQDRHLFVDDVRQNRTTLDPRSIGSLFAGSSSDNASFILTGKGAQVALSWPTNRGALGRGVEFIWAGGKAGWTEPRCAVDYVAALNSTHVSVVMMQPCFFNLRYRGGGLCFFGVNTHPQMVENVGVAYIRQPHEWALVNHQGRVDVQLALPADSDPRNATVWLPRLETIIGGYHVKHVKFTGIQFGYATWLRPGQKDGFVDFQGGACLIGNKPGNQNCSEDQTQIITPGNIYFRSSTDIVFESCSFVHMGASAVEFSNGATGCMVDGCGFTDISGAAVQIGSVNSSYIGHEHSSQWDRFNIVNNSVISQPAAELHGIPGINVGYSFGTILSHNEVFNTTWVGISMGYGWSRHPESWAGNNTILGNRVHDYKKRLHDGGGIYTLGPQNGSKITRNWVYRQVDQSMGAYYPDEGNQNTEFSHNVASALNDGRPARPNGNAWWLFLWKNTIRNCPIFSNFAENGTGCWNAGSNCSMWDNTLFQPGAPPPTAQAIMDGSGTKGNAFNQIGESQSYWDTLQNYRGESLASFNSAVAVDTLTNVDVGADMTGFSCAAPGSPPPPPGHTPEFNPPFENCHC